MQCEGLCQQATADSRRTSGGVSETHSMSVCSVCQCVCLSVWVSICLSINLSACLSIGQTLCVSGGVSLIQRITVCVCLFMSVCLCLCLSVCLSTKLFVSIHLSEHLLALTYVGYVLSLRCRSTGSKPVKCIQGPIVYVSNYS